MKIVNSFLERAHAANRVDSGPFRKMLSHDVVQPIIIYVTITLMAIENSNLVNMGRFRVIFLIIEMCCSILTLFHFNNSTVFNS